MQCGGCVRHQLTPALPAHVQSDFGSSRGGDDASLGLSARRVEGALTTDPLDRVTAWVV